METSCYSLIIQDEVEMEWNAKTVERQEDRRAMCRENRDGGLIVLDKRARKSLDRKVAVTLTVKWKWESSSEEENCSNM